MKGAHHCPCLGPGEEYPPGTRHQPGEKGAQDREATGMPLGTLALLCSKCADLSLDEVSCLLSTSVPSPSVPARASPGLRADTTSGTHLMMAIHPKGDSSHHPSLISTGLS